MQILMRFTLLGDLSIFKLYTLALHPPKPSFSPFPTSEASSSGPLFTLFVSTWGHWTVSAGEHDFRVTVADPSWQVQQVVMDRSQERCRAVPRFRGAERRSAVLVGCSAWR